MARHKKEVVNKMDMSLDDIIAMNRSARGRGRGGSWAAGEGNPVGRRRPWRQQAQVVGAGGTNVRQRVQKIQKKARMMVLRKRLQKNNPSTLTAPINIVSRGRGRGGRGRGGRGRGWSRGRGGGVVGEMNKEETVQNPVTMSTVGRFRGRGRSLVRGRGVGSRGKLNTVGGLSSSPSVRPGSRLKIIRGLKGRGRGQNVIAIKRRLSTGSLQLQPQTTPTRGRERRGRGRGRGRGSLSVGSTPVAGSSQATPLRVSVSQEQMFEPVGVDLLPDFGATHHTRKSLNSRFSQTAQAHVQRMVMADGRNVQYS